MWRGRSQRQQRLLGRRWNQTQFVRLVGGERSMERILREQPWRLHTPVREGQWETLGGSWLCTPSRGRGAWVTDQTRRLFSRPGADPWSPEAGSDPHKKKAACVLVVRDRVVSEGGSVQALYEYVWTLRKGLGRTQTCVNGPPCTSRSWTTVHSITYL